MLHYNPSISIKENAKRNHCTESAIRKHIRVNGIDRRFDKKAQIINSIRKELDKDNTLTISALAKITNYSIGTIRKYYEYATSEAELSKIDTQKVSKINIRQKNNYYATHPSTVRDLLQVESFDHQILEPCCGGGFMAEEIKNGGYDVDAYDIVDRHYGKKADFLTYDFEIGVRDIITNPPYTNVIAFIQRALDLCKNKVAILMPLRYLSSKERVAFYKVHPPVRVYVYVNRICIAKNGDFEKYEKGQNLEMYAWYIWEKGYQGDTILKWIYNVE